VNENKILVVTVTLVNHLPYYYIILFIINDSGINLIT